jgi:hypothetical protein
MRRLLTEILGMNETMKKIDDKITLDCTRDLKTADVYICRIRPPSGEVSNNMTSSQEVPKSEARENAAVDLKEEQVSLHRDAVEPETETVTLHRITMNGREYFERIEPDDSPVRVAPEKSQQISPLPSSPNEAGHDPPTAGRQSARGRSLIKRSCPISGKCTRTQATPTDQTREGP